MACHFHKLHTHATFTDDWKKERNYSEHLSETLLFACIFLLERYLRQWAACGQDKTGNIKPNEWLKIQSLLQYCCIGRLLDCRYTNHKIKRQKIESYYMELFDQKITRGRSPKLHLKLLAIKEGASSGYKT